MYLKSFIVIILLSILFSSHILFSQYNVWIPIGPYCGDIQALACDPLRPDTLYAGTYGGIFKSMNGGASWVEINHGLEDPWVQTIAIDPGNPRSIYLGTSRCGVYKSLNGGVSWSASNIELYQFDIHALVIDPQQPNILYAGTFGKGIYQSTNYGETWEARNEGLTNLYVRCLAINPTNPAIIYAGTSYRGIFVSRNAGDSWTQLFCDEMDPPNVFSIVIDPQHPNILYAGVCGDGVYKINLDDSTCIADSNGLSDKYVRSLAIDPRNPQTLYAGSFNSGIFKKESVSSPWRSINVQMAADEVRAILVHPQNSSIVYAGTYEGGIYKSYNGGEIWGDINYGLTVASIHTLLVPPNNPGSLFAGCSKGLFRRSRLHPNWKTWLSNKFISAMAINPRNSNHILVGAGREGVIFTKNNGQSWFYFNAGLPVWRKISDYTNTIVFDPMYDPDYGTIIYVGTTKGIFKIMGNDTVWTDIAPSKGANVQTIAIRLDQPNFIFIGTKDGLYKSDDRGQSWVKYDIGLPLSPNVRSIIICPENDYIMYASIWGSSIYKTMNGGQSWAYAGSALGSRYINALVIDPTNPHIVYAGTNGRGVYKTIDEAKNWHSLNPDLTDQYVNALAVDGNRLYAGTRGGGAYEIEMQPVISISELGHNFGEVRVDSSRVWSFTISNNGLAELRISEIEVTLPVFEVNQQTIDIPPSQSKTLYVSFNPTQRGLVSSLLRISCNDPDKNSISLHLQAKAISPIINLGGVERLDFDGVYVNKFLDKVLSIYNLGDAPLLIDSIGFSNDRFTILNKDEFTIPPKDSRAITIRFSPDSIKLESGVMSIYSDDPTLYPSPLTLTLTGEGTYALLNLQPDSIDFGDAFVLGHKDSSLVVENSGTGQLKIYKITSDDSNFIIIGPSSFTVDPSNQEGFAIRFQPRTSGPHRGRLFIENNSMNDSLKFVIVKGNGLTAQLNADVKAIDFELVTLNSEKDSAFTLFNIGNTSINVQNIFSTNPYFTIQSPKQFILQADQNRTVSIRFIPISVESQKGQILVAYETSERDTLKIDVKGRVIFKAGVLSDTIQGGTEQTAFRMISVPAILDTQDPVTIFSSIFGEYNRKKWRMFRWERSQRQEYQTAQLSQVRPGNAFWIISKTTRIIEYGSGTSTPVDQPYEITLEPGWNQIGCPYPFSVSWQEVVSATNQSDLLDTLYYYDGSYFISHKLVPYEGYWVYNKFQEDSISLMIPPIKAGSLHKQSGTNFPAHTADGWWLQIHAKCLSASDHINYLGICEDASAEWDRHDFREPPPIGEYVSIFFPHDDWQNDAGRYTTDFKPITNQGQSWNFILESNIPTGTKIDLRIENIEKVPEEYEIILFDESAKVAHDIRRSLEFHALTGKPLTSKRFRIIVGEKDFVKKNSPDIALSPQNFKLYPNYPNPFSEATRQAEPLTVIQYALPCECEVSLLIYDVMGREIKRLVSKKQAAGTYQVFWNATDQLDRRVPSGIYFYKIRAGMFVDVRKLVFAR